MSKFEIRVQNKKILSNWTIEKLTDLKSRNGTVKSLQSDFDVLIALID